MASQGKKKEEKEMFEGRNDAPVKLMSRKKNQRWGGERGDKKRKEKKRQHARRREEKQADEKKEAVSLTHCKLIKWEYSLLPASLWSCSAALSKTALLLQSIAP